MFKYALAALVVAAAIDATWADGHFLNVDGEASQCAEADNTFDSTFGCESEKFYRTGHCGTGEPAANVNRTVCLSCNLCDASSGFPPEADNLICPECCSNTITGEAFRTKNSLDESCKALPPPPAPPLPGYGPPQDIESETHCRSFCGCFAAAGNSGKGWGEQYSAEQRAAAGGDTSCACYDSECYCGGVTEGEQVPNCGCANGYGGEKCDEPGGALPMTQRKGGNVALEPGSGGNVAPEPAVPCVEDNDAVAAEGWPFATCSLGCMALAQAPDAGMVKKACGFCCGCDDNALCAEGGGDSAASVTSSFAAVAVAAAAVAVL